MAIKTKDIPKIILSACLSVCIVVTLFLSLIFIKYDGADTPKQTLTKVDLAASIPPPPPPPEPKHKVPNAQSESTSMNLVGLGGSIRVEYGEVKSLSLPKVKDLKAPEFNLDDFKMLNTFSSNIPLLEVEYLDKVPKVVRQKFVKPPKSIRKYQTKRIATKVELIIDQTGKPFIKKIVDPVYPEMVETIKVWVQHAKFEIPKKEGKPVQAVYFYGINFNYG